MLYLFKAIISWCVCNSVHNYSILSPSLSLSAYLTPYLSSPARLLTHAQKSDISLKHTRYIKRFVIQRKFNHYPVNIAQH